MSNKPSNEIAEDIVTLAESVKKISPNILIRNIATHQDDYKTEADEVNEILQEIYCKRAIPLIGNKNRSRLYLNDTGISVLVSNFFN